ncbi:UNVERIFIED_ORG: hypothetical protein FHU00_4853 [Citrobacter freundii]
MGDATPTQARGILANLYHYTKSETLGAGVMSGQPVPVPVRIEWNDSRNRPLNRVGHYWGWQYPRIRVEYGRIGADQPMGMPA